MESKPAIQSKTVWGILIALAPPTIEFLNQVINSGILQVIPTPYSAVISYIGGAIAIYGKVKGTQKIEGIFKAPEHREVDHE